MGEWVDNPVCELGRLHTQQVSTAVTNEEGDLLYALVRMAKPSYVLETGAGHGVSTVRIGEALRDNGFGGLHTCETREALVDEVRGKVYQLPVQVHNCRGIEMINGMCSLVKPGLVFLDSGHPPDRLEELNKLLELDCPPNGGYLVIHDVLNPNDGDYRIIFDSIKAYGWPHLVLESNAGISVFRRPK